MPAFSKLFFPKLWTIHRFDHVVQKRWRTGNFFTRTRSKPLVVKLAVIFLLCFFFFNPELKVLHDAYPGCFTNVCGRNFSLIYLKLRFCCCSCERATLSLLLSRLCVSLFFDPQLKSSLVIRAWLFQWTICISKMKWRWDKYWACMPKLIEHLRQVWR